VRDLLAHFGIADDPVALIGVSGMDGSNNIGTYDDRFYHCYGGDVTPYPGNVDPSALAKGRATLAPMRVFHYRAGIHGLSKPKARQYAALVQAEQVTVLRHGQGAGTGWFGINHHRGGVNSTSSLGCQTYPPHVWSEAKSRLYAAIGASDAEVMAGRRSGRPFPYVVIPFARAMEILQGNDAPPEHRPAPARRPPPRRPPTAPTWSIRLQTAPGEAEEVYDRAINIAGRVFVPVRDFCVAALDCKAEDAPLTWEQGPDDSDVLTIAGCVANEVTEVDGRAFVWIVEVAAALGYTITRNEAAKNLLLTRRG